MISSWPAGATRLQALLSDRLVESSEGGETPESHMASGAATHRALLQQQRQLPYETDDFR